MARMVARSGALVSFGTTVEVVVDGGDVWVQQVAFDEADAPGRFQPVPGSGSIDVPTPAPGGYTRIVLVEPNSGPPDAGGQVIDELVVPRLDPDARRTYLTDCSEGTPQLVVGTGGTYVQATVGSGPVESVGQLFLGKGVPEWSGSMPFPVFGHDDFLLSAVSTRRGFVHDLLVVDRRDAQRTTNPLLDADQTLGFVALVWDSDGAWDFTWTQTAGLPSTPDAGMAAPQTMQTRTRTVELDVVRFVCLDDSDDLSDGEATFTITMQPSFAPAEQRSVGWDPMETGSVLAVNQTFTITGAEASHVWVNVQGVEDDSGSVPSDDDDVANTPQYVPVYRRGPGAEAFREDATLDSGVGNDGFHYLVHCAATVTYA